MNCHRLSIGLMTTAMFCVASSTVLASDFHRPDQPGPYRVGAAVFPATMTGGRVTKVQVFYPTLAPCNPASFYTVNAAAGTYRLRSPLGATHDASPAPGPFPLVVFDHGGGGAGNDFQRFGQLPLDETMASHGIVTVVALHSADPIVRVRDLSVVINVVLARNAAAGDLFFGRIDPTRIGISGSSAGGSAALGAAGGLVGQGITRDARIKAMVVYEPSIISFDDARTISVPYLVMGGLQFKGGIGVPALFEATTAAPRVYVQTPNAAHFSYITGLPSELEQTREQALLANPNIPEPLTTLTSTNAAAARAYEIWNWGEILHPLLGPGIGSGRNLCDRVGVNSVRSLDFDGNGFTDSPPFKRVDPPILPNPATRAEEMIPLIKFYTVAFWKARLAGDCRYERFLSPGWRPPHPTACRPR